MSAEIAKVLARAMNSCLAHEGEPILGNEWSITCLVSENEFVKTNMRKVERILAYMIDNGFACRPLLHDQRFIGLTDKGIKLAES